MKRRIPHLAAAVAELVRFLALMLLSAKLGVIGAAGDEGGGAFLLRYAAAPQLLFAAGFFFLWLDFGRYGIYRPLLAIGKIAALVALLPLSVEIGYYRFVPQASVVDPRGAGSLALAIAAVDLGSLALLILYGRREKVVSPSVASAAPRAESVERVELEIPAADGKPRATGVGDQFAVVQSQDGAEKAGS